MQVTALLPMKAHSERVPNKNVKDFDGLPLYHHMAGVLETSPLVDRILIDTDSPHIATEAQQTFSKVNIIERPTELCGDFVSMNAIIAHDIGTTDGEHFVQTHSTNPLLTKATLEEAIHTYFDSLLEYDSLFSVTRHQCRFFFQDGKAVNHDPQELLRTQDLPPLYEENSNFYIFSKQSFKASGNMRIGLKPQMFEMNKLEAIDIDEPEDWDLALYLHESRQSR